AGDVDQAILATEDHVLGSRLKAGATSLPCTSPTTMATQTRSPCIRVSVSTLRAKCGTAASHLNRPMHLAPALSWRRADHLARSLKLRMLPTPPPPVPRGSGFRGPCHTLRGGLRSTHPRRPSYQ